MPSLDEMFASLSADADRVPPPDLAMVETSGRRLRVRRLATVGVAALALVLLAGTAVGVGHLRRQTAPYLDPAQPGPVHFQPLHTVGPAMAFSSAGTLATTPVTSTTIDSGRGFAVWSLPNGEAYAVAIDLRTNASLWTAHRVGGQGNGNGILVVGGVLVTVVGPSEDTAGQASTMTVLDPGTGAELWRGPFDVEHTQPLLSPAALVLIDSDTGVMTGLDWRSGRTRWTVTDPSHRIAYARGVASAGDVANAAGDTLRYTDPRVVTAGADGVLRVYDTATGALRSTRPAPPGEPAFGYEGQLYTVTPAAGSTPRQVYATDPFGTAAPRLIYTLGLPTAPREIPLTPCGNHWICVVDGAGITGAGSPKLVAIDPDTGSIPWLVAGLPDPRMLMPIGARVLDFYDGGVDLLGPYSPVLMPLITDRPGTVLRVDAGSALSLFASRNEPGLPASQPRDTEVVGVAVASGSAENLGTVAIAPLECAADTSSLFCPSDIGLQVWRFAVP